MLRSWGLSLWRKGSIRTERGLRPRSRVPSAPSLVLDHGEDAAGFFSLPGPGAVSRGVLALPWGALAQGTQAIWGLVGGAARPVWGPDDALVAHWSGAIARGESVWWADTGTYRPVAAADAITTLRTAVERRAMRWQLVGSEAAGLRDLLDVLGEGLGKTPRAWRVPAGLAARRAGVDASLWSAWAKASEGKTKLEGWERPHWVGRAGWLGDVGRWRTGDPTG